MSIKIYLDVNRNDISEIAICIDLVTDCLLFRI